MTDPKENEEINEELSTDELKDVSGGIVSEVGMDGAMNDNRFAPWKGPGTLSIGDVPKGPGSGSGKTKADFERDNKATQPGIPWG